LRRPILVKLATALAVCVGLAVAGVSIASGGAAPEKRSPKPSAKAARPLAKSPVVARRSGVEAVEKGEPNEPSETESESAGETEGAADSAAQAAACGKARIDPNGDNVEFDEQSGSCSIDHGGDSAD